MTQDEPENNPIPWEVFELLTGRPRLEIPDFSRDIEIIRDKGHIKIFDSKFQVGQRYKKDGRIYTCKIVSKEDGLALFEPCSPELKVISTKDPRSMEIV
jgi:hypothetical protein